MNLEGVTLKLLLQEQDSEVALEVYSELRPDYFSNSFKAVLRHIKEFYDNVGHVPNMKDLSVYRSRNVKVSNALASLDLIDCAGIDIKLAIDELANQHAQTALLDMIDELLEKVTMLDRHTLVDTVASIPLKLDELIETSNTVHSAKDIPLFVRPEQLKKAKITAGLSDEWDEIAGGYFRQELVLLGGKVGSGKSIACANLIANQHEQGLPSLIFTVEMSAKEVFDRILAMLAGVCQQRLRKGELTTVDTYKLAMVQAGLFEGGAEVFHEHFILAEVPDPFKFQDELQKLPEITEGRIIIIDDKDLSLPNIDTKVSIYKKLFGDSLGLVVVDYLNQVCLESGGSIIDIYDWKTQIVVSKMLKNLARKHDVCFFSPYQMDDNGVARFSKGILDACDIAQLLKVPDKDSETMILETTKARSTSNDGVHGIGINWETLRICPKAVDLTKLDQSDDKDDEQAPKASDFKKSGEVMTDGGLML